MNKLDAKKRGYVDNKEIFLYSKLSSSELLLFLHDDSPVKRTIGATLIGLRKEKEYIRELIKALEKEKKLYPKIAISEALGNIGEAAVADLIPYLGKIGSNQYIMLPEKAFLKSNYPIPRDIVARTICKIGSSAIPILIKNLDVNNQAQLSEGIDALGYISYYNYTDSAKNYLLELFQKQTDLLIRWKLIRAFQAFSGSEIINLLQMCIKTSLQQPLVWEAKRSLRQIQVRVSK